AEAPVQSSGDPALAAPAALLQPVPEPPQLDLPARAADVRVLAAGDGERGLLGHRPRRAPVVLLGPDPDHDAVDGRRPDRPGAADPAAETGELGAAAAGAGPPAVLQLSRRGPDAERAAGARGAHPPPPGQVPRVPGDGEGLSRRAPPP